MRHPRLSLATALLAAACGSEGASSDDPTAPEGPGGKSTEAPDLSGKADGQAAVQEMGRLSLTAGAGATVTAEVTDRMLAWRFRGHGATKVRISATSSDPAVDPYLAIDGPLPDETGTALAWNDDASPEDKGALIETTLEAAGAYRVIAGTYASFQGGEGASGPVTVTVTCLEGCAAKEWTLAEVIADLQAKHGREQLGAMLSQAIGGLFPDAATADAVRTQGAAWLAATTPDEAFPAVPLAAIATAQALLEQGGAEAPAPAVVTFQLDALLTESCHVERSSLKPAHPALPDLQTGSAPDYTIEDCRLQRARDFASVLNNLALENGSAVVNGPTRYETVEDVFTALLDAGHHIRVENNRYFADFLGLSYQGRPIMAPVWLDTGIALTDGSTLKLPAPHSHHTIHVEGPILNATIMYYMGVSGGVSFRAVEGARPHWSGERTLYVYDSATDREQIVQLMVAAGDLRRKWTEEGAGLRALGYGQLGVCNDSTAVLEYGAEGTVTIFPLAHPASDAERQSGDAIDRTLAALPTDIDGFDAAEALARIRTTQPFEAEADLPFPGLRAQLALAP